MIRTASNMTKTIVPAGSQTSGLSSGVGPDAVTSAFLSAMDKAPKRVLDEKGEDSLSEWGVGDQRLAMFFKLCRGLGRPALNEFVRNVVAEALKRGKEGNPEQEVQGYVDLMVMAFQTRDIDEGKGERQLFYWMLLEMYKYFPETVLASLPLIPARYGSWKDIKLLLEILQEDLKGVKGAFRKNPQQDDLEKLEEAFLLMFETQLWDDDKVRAEIFSLRSKAEAEGWYLGPLNPMEECLQEEDQASLKRKLGELQVGLCGKWAPREGRHFSWLAKRMAIRMYHDKPDFRSDGSVRTDSVDDAEKAIQDARSKKADRGTMDALGKNLKAAQQSCYKRYRQLCARLNKHIKTAEVMMCDVEGKWDHLVPGAIPARCLKIHRKAFFNQICKGPNKGQQRSTRADRIACAEKFVKHMEEAIKNPGGKKKVHGKNLMPHELVQIYFEGRETEMDLTLEAQWVDIREKLKESGALGKFVVMSDVSGSMSGIPMMVSIAFGVLISELNHPAFRNRFLTFESDPKWHILKEGDNLFQKVQSAKNARWGGSTNFESALNLILRRCVEGNVPADEVMEMTFAIFSDMQFNTADGQDGYYGRGGPAFSTKIQKIKAAFAKAGYKDPETGEGLMPRMLFWNLRGDTLDFPCDANTPGVDMVSGFSANGLKAFMAGEEMQSADPDKKETPYDGMRKQLDVERYDPIRALCGAVGEIVSKTSGEAYVAPVRETDEEEEEEAILIKAMDSGEEKDAEEAVDPAQIDAEMAELEKQLAELRAKKEKATASPEIAKGGLGFGW
jgi:hypothetical protein